MVLDLIDVKRLMVIDALKHNRIGRAKELLVEIHAIDEAVRRKIELDGSAWGQRLAELMVDLPIRDPEIPLVNNVEAGLVTRKEEVRDGLVRQVTAPVRWSDCVLRLSRAGASVFVEVGPGKVLSGLVRRILPSAQTVSVGTVDEVQSYG